ncbi:MAG: phage portal protein [Rickettsiales bacterium]|jgi:HK97 family phage portal protein|nr:phage portal protein [Rickettsiales bacterium]
MKFFTKNKKEIKLVSSNNFSSRVYYQNVGKPVWTNRDFVNLAEESYNKNVIANRCINIIAKGAASIKFVLLDKKTGDIINSHEILDLLTRPNPFVNQMEFFETIYSQKLIAGNCFIQAIFADNNKFYNPKELYILRPDRINIIAGKNLYPLGYRYKIDNREIDFPINQLNGQSEILHIKNYNPTNDWYGLSQVEPAAYSIDQHNEASRWNQSILQNGAKPCGALIVKNEGENNNLTDEQFLRLKEQLNEEFSGSSNAGKPLLLEGGLDWKEISLSPKEMDFLEMKHSTARDIALSFGVPSQLIGIPGDNTYNNMAEARLFLWEQTIIPTIESVLNSINNWIIPMFGVDMLIGYDKNLITPLLSRKETFWNLVSNSDFLSIEEKKKILGL